MDAGGSPTKKKKKKNKKEKIGKKRLREEEEEEMTKYSGGLQFDDASYPVYGLEEDGKEEKKGREEGRKQVEEIVEKDLQPRRKKRRFMNQSKIEKKSKVRRTLKIRNVPFNGEKLQFHKRKMKSLCKKFGVIESIRFRNLPVNTFAKAPNEEKFRRIPVDVAVKTKRFKVSDKGETMVSFVVFADQENLDKVIDDALTGINLAVYDKNKLFAERVFTHKESRNEEGKEQGLNRKIFVGNVPFDCSEEELFDLFKKKENFLGGKIKSVEILKQGRKITTSANYTQYDWRKNNKGCAVVCFDNDTAVRNSLNRKMNVVIRGKKLRLSKYISKTGMEKRRSNNPKKKTKRDRNHQGRVGKFKYDGRRNVIRKDELWRGKKFNEDKKVVLKRGKPRKKKKTKKKKKKKGDK